MMKLNLMYSENDEVIVEGVTNRFTWKISTKEFCYSI